MTKGVNKDWTPKSEAIFQKWIDTTSTLAGRFVAVDGRNTLKYNPGTRAAKQAMATLRFMLVAATDEDLVQIVKIREELMRKNELSPDSYFSDEEIIRQLRELRDIRKEVRASVQGIHRPGAN